MCSDGSTLIVVILMIHRSAVVKYLAGRRVAEAALSQSNDTETERIQLIWMRMKFPNLKTCGVLEKLVQI